MWNEAVDLDEIRIGDITIYKSGTELKADIADVNLADLLDSIGGEKVREYFNIPEGE